MTFSSVPEPNTILPALVIFPKSVSYLRLKLLALLSRPPLHPCLEKSKQMSLQKAASKDNRTL